ncbi:universal stress protein [Acrocarpospora sp. B8E8]
MTSNRAVVMGYDGSDYSMQALYWAMDEAELRRSPLIVMHAWSWPYGEASEEAKSHLRNAAEHVLWHGADCARSCSTVAEVRADLHEGSASERLAELSGEAGLVVVGSRGLGATERAAVGSVAVHVASHASCPVIVVRGAGPIPVPAHPGPLVVGVGSAPDDAVMGFAFKEAELRRVRLVALQAEPAPASRAVATPFARAGESVVPPCQDDALRMRLKPWQEEHPLVRVDTSVVTMLPGSALQEASRDASLIVVGRHEGLGPTAGALLQEATCPVAVVPAT